MVGESRATSHRAKVEAVGRSAGGQRVEKRRHAGCDGAIGLEKIAALEDVSHSRIFGALGEDQLARPFGMLAP